MVVSLHDQPLKPVSLVRKEGLSCLMIQGTMRVMQEGGKTTSTYISTRHDVTSRQEESLRAMGDCSGALAFKV